MTYAAAGNLGATASRIAQAYENFEGVVAALGDLSRPRRSASPPTTSSNSLS